MKLSIYVLVDNVASTTCNAEHGLSYVIDFDHRVLFDTGQSDLFIRNSYAMGLSIDEIDTVVLSHGHYDHGNGLNMLQNKTLIAHPNVFTSRFSGKQRKPVGLNVSMAELAGQLKMRLSTEPQWISESICFLGEIPRKFGFERLEAGFYIENNQSDQLFDDSALVIKMKQGLFVISGCAHSGICNTIEHAKKICNEEKVFGVFGGFHLKFNNKQTQETVAYLKQNEVQIVMPSHCTDLPALSVFCAEFGGEQVRAGTLYTFDEV